MEISNYCLSFDISYVSYMYVYCLDGFFYENDFTDIIIFSLYIYHTPNFWNSIDVPSKTEFSLFTVITIPTLVISSNLGVQDTNSVCRFMENVVFKTPEKRNIESDQGTLILYTIK